MNGQFEKFPVTSCAGHPEDLHWMGLALEQAKKAQAIQEVPIGAVLLIDGRQVACAHNAPVSKKDACAHAEIQTIQQACLHVSNYRLGSSATMYVTLQPCLMCLGAIFHARIGRVVIACEQSRYTCNLRHALSVFEEAQVWHSCRFEMGCMQAQSEELLRNFFKAQRRQRETAIAELADMRHLPNVNKETVQILAQLGYVKPEDFLHQGLEKVSQDLKTHASVLKQKQIWQQAAVFAGLCDYFEGKAVCSWKGYL